MKCERRKNMGAVQAENNNASAVTAPHPAAFGWLHAVGF